MKPLNDAATLEPENRFEFDFNTVSADVSELNKPFAKVSPQVPIQAPSTSEFVEGPLSTGRLTVPKIALSPVMEHPQSLDSLSDKIDNLILTTHLEFTNMKPEVNTPNSLKIDSQFSPTSAQRVPTPRPTDILKHNNFQFSENEEKECSVGHPSQDASRKPECAQHLQTVEELKKNDMVMKEFAKATSATKSNKGKAKSAGSSHETQKRTDNFNENKEKKAERRVSSAKTVGGLNAAIKINNRPLSARDNKLTREKPISTTSDIKHESSKSGHDPIKEGELSSQNNLAGTAHRSRKLSLNPGIHGF